MSTPLCQIALSVSDLLHSHAWYTGAFGYHCASGTNAFKGYFSSKVQGVANVVSSCWWLMDNTEFFQLELFQFHSPKATPLPASWRPCDIGYSTVSLQVADLDLTLARLAALGSEPLSAPQGEPGQRRACVRDPDGILLELMESDPTALGVNRLTADCPVATVAITVSVPDIEKSKQFFCAVLGLTPAPEIILHRAEHEALWGLTGASAKREVFRAGSLLVELAQYEQPLGLPWPEGYRISDLGILNIALGYRSRKTFKSSYQRCLQAEIKGNWRPLDLGNWEVVYVNDTQGFSVELLCVKPWWDWAMGFRRTASAPQLPVAGFYSTQLTQTVGISAQHVWQLLSAKLNSANNDFTVGEACSLQLNDKQARLRITAARPGQYIHFDLIDGLPLKQCSGTLHLLPCASGTEAQWQFRFRPKFWGCGKLSQRWLTRVLRNAFATL